MAEKSNSAVSENAVASDPWASAPDAPLIEFLSTEQRAILVNSRAVLYMRQMEYDKNGRFGPEFTALFMCPDGELRRMSMPTNRGRSPRDVKNKWMWELTRDRKLPEGGLPVQLCKAGNAFFLDKPGTESERIDDGFTGSADDGGFNEEPPF